MNLPEVTRVGVRCELFELRCAYTRQTHDLGQGAAVPLDAVLVRAAEIRLRLSRKESLLRKGNRE